MDDRDKHLEREAKRLAKEINLRLQALRAGASPADIGPIVAEVAPGWEYLERTKLGAPHPSIVLTLYNPGEPL